MSTWHLTNKSGVGSKFFGTLFFLVFGGVGLVLFMIMIAGAFKIAQTYTWPKVACLVLNSKAVNDPAKNDSHYRFEVKYQYTWQGQSFTSEQFSRSSATFSDFSKVQRLLEKFKSDRPNFCFVNPKKPAEAILERENFWFLPFIIIPVVFIFVGFGATYSLWRNPQKNAVADTGPVTDKGRQPKWLVAFFAMFFLSGAAAAWAMGIHPLLNILAARSWQAVPCTVVSSRVQSHSGEHGSTYSIDILYAYEFEGQEYKSSRYDFVNGSSSGYQAKADVVRRYPPRTKTTCYVNPKNPFEAVINRGFRMAILGWGLLFPIPFLAVGIGGFWFFVRKKQPKRVSAKSLYSPTTKPTPAPQTPRKSRVSRLGKFIVALVFAAFWNGMIWALPMREVWQSWQHHHFQWGLALFMIPFVLVGLLLVGLAIYSFLALFNPKVILSLDPASPNLGDLVHVHWDIQGNANRIKRLRIYLEGREEVQSQENSDSSKTSKSQFTSFELANIDRAELMTSGQAEVKIPADTVPTFTASHNKIIWAIHIDGEIPRWPDIQDEFPITVGPLPVVQIARA